ncbi:ComF family protein [Sphingobium sp. H39-3-25]|uniref:ComF family protein n=1 Tax=Sphingobium arseniciresistens TaxID=3030834 RepID=UPI0023BA1480|nr:ComF family protein [Sphingobium arseniciresistens]
MPDTTLLRRTLRPLLDAVVDYALPPRCPGCGVIVQEDDRFCLSCWSGMRFLGDPCCCRCGVPLPPALGEGAECGVCMADPPAFDSARAVLAYGDVARTVALKFKYGRRIGLARLIAGHMRKHLPHADRATMLIVPVPLHRWRLWWRGFNQAALIADRLGEAGGVGGGKIAVDKDVLRRTRRTPPLRGHGAKARAKVVRGAFSLHPDARARLQGRCVILIDDIHTSGATADACARMLRRGGASSVHLLCWARVLPDAMDGSD